MWHVGIVERAGGHLLRDAREHLAGLPFAVEPYRPETCYDIVAVEDGVCLTVPVRGSIAVLPGGFDLPAEAGLALTYGMAETDTVRLSSADDRTGLCVVSLQRDILDLAGEWVCCQDSVLPLQLPAARILPLAALIFLCPGAHRDVQKQK